LGGKAPASLLEPKKKLLAAADRPAQEQTEALALFHRQQTRIIADVWKCGAEAERIKDAAGALGLPSKQGRPAK
jgi:hypothetical protein